MQAKAELGDPLLRDRGKRGGGKRRGLRRVEGLLPGALDARHVGEIGKRRGRRKALR